MAISFPNNPSLNDTFTSGGITFTWNGTNWVSSKDSNILADTTPQLGGNLDVNGRDITGTGNINVTGTITATSFSGDGSALTGAGTTTTAEWTLGADGSSHYTFTGPGVTAGATDPTIYLTRGQTYKFKNRSGGHPFRIQYEFQNTGGTAYNDGIVNNAAGNGTDLYWEVRNDTPDTLYYQCTSHTNMSGRINMIGGESKVVGLTSTTATARDAGITTATGSIIYIPDVGMQVYSGDEGGWKTIADTAGGSTGITATSSNAVTPAVGLQPGNGYVYHTFTGSGTLTVTEGTGNIEYLIIGGGGAGGGGYYRIAGGGGAGGLLSNSPEVPTTSQPRGNATQKAAYEISPGQYTITVGGGGAGGQVNTGAIQPGSPSDFYPTPVSYPDPTYLRAFGGGGGAGNPNPGSNGGAGSAGDPGGSGGGYTESGSSPWGYAANGTPGQGSGGVGPASGASGGGGGGGASGQLPDPQALESHGTSGIQMPAWTGPLIGVPALGPLSGYWAGGGGGGTNSNRPAPSGQGGLGGGGRGNLWPNSRPGEMPATVNSGGGGGGGVAHENGSPGGGAGGSGIVVIRYPA